MPCGAQMSVTRHDFFWINSVRSLVFLIFFFNDTATTEIYTLSLHDALPIYGFIDSIWLERGLSQNTLSAYRQDLSNFSNWLNPVNLENADKVSLLDYLAYRLKEGYSSRSTARSLSSLRAFYAYLVSKSLINENPTSKIQSPKLGHSLPKVLSEEDVEKLIKAPDTKVPLGLRDRAMLELLYACGLRI